TARFGLPDIKADVKADACLGGVPVLVIADDSAKQLGPLLRDWGMAPVIAAGKQPALQAVSGAVEAGKPMRVALLDCAVSESAELPARIRAISPQTETIVLTNPPDEARLLALLQNVVNGATAVYDAPHEQGLESLAILLAEDTPLNQRVA